MVQFYFLKETILEWKGNIGVQRDRFISYFKAKKIASKGYIYHLVRVRDIEAYPTTLQSVLVVSEFLDIFPKDLPSLPPE